MGPRARVPGRRSVLVRQPRAGGSSRATTHPLLDLQAAAGNQAVTQFVQRRAIMVGGVASDVRFTVGQEISRALARKAKAAAAGGVTTAELGPLRQTALADGTITDDERMFLAGLLDSGNATTAATMATTAGSAVSFSAGTIRPHLATVADSGRTALDPIVDQELKDARAEYLTNYNPHMRAARDAAIKQIHALIGPPWRAKADALISASTLWTGEVLRAMLAAASDSTAGDRVMAGMVYLIASQANHPLAGDVQAGRIKVDQMPQSSLKDKFAEYSAFGSGSKGDTIYVKTELSLQNLAHREAVIHELEHAADDKSTPAAHWRPTTHDAAEVRAYRAGARYTLDQLAARNDAVASARRGGSPAERRAAQQVYDQALVDISGTAHPIVLISLALEAHRDRTRFEMRVIDVNAAFPAAARASTGDVVRLIQGTDLDVERTLRDQIRVAYKLLAPNGAIDPAKNLGRFDALSGESLLDTIDLPRI